MQFKRQTFVASQLHDAGHSRCSVLLRVAYHPNNDCIVADPGPVGHEKSRVWNFQEIKELADGQW
jgi:hypothetical protein